MDGNSYPARCQHFHSCGISEAWLLKDRGIWVVVCLQMPLQPYRAAREPEDGKPVPQAAAAWELRGDALLGSGMMGSVCHERCSDGVLLTEV